MKILSSVVVIAIAISTVTANARGNRRGGPAIINGGARHHGGGANWHRPPTFRPPAFRPPIYRPPYRPPIVNPGYPPPVLPPPIIEPVVPVYPEPVYPDPVYPVPNPIPDPIEEQTIYGLPPQIYVDDPCDPTQFEVPVINTIPAQSVYCSSAYYNQCQQTYRRYRVIRYDVRAAGNCQVRPTVNGTAVLLLNNSVVLAEESDPEAIAIRYRNSVRMGICG